MIFTSPWGVTLKQLKEEDSTPEFLDFKVKNSQAWEDSKKRMNESYDDGIDWMYLEETYPK